MKKIIFVCHGNICRSPMAEFIFKHIARLQGRENEFQITSAAVSNEESGNDIYQPAKEILRAQGIEFSRHRAHKITKEELLDADYIIVMDYSNIRLLRRIIDSYFSDTAIARKCLEKVHLQMEWLYRSGNAENIREVSDPWYTGEYRRTFNDLYEGCTAMFDFL